MAGERRNERILILDKWPEYVWPFDTGISRSPCVHCDFGWLTPERLMDKDKKHYNYLFTCTGEDCCGQRYWLDWWNVN